MGGLMPSLAMASQPKRTATLSRRSVSMCVARFVTSDSGGRWGEEGPLGGLASP